jgi:hypothetical protein
MPDVGGSIRNVTLDGVSYRTSAATNIKEVGSAYENSLIVTSGGNMLKKMKRAEEREGVELEVNGKERDDLRTLADRTEPFPMSYETAAGDIYRATGWIEFESRETEENKATVKLLPQGEWESFLK